MVSSTVLVVETASTARDALVALLRDADLEVTVLAEGGNPAGQMVAVVSVDQGDATAIRRLVALHQPPEIIALIEYGAATDALMALRAGASDYVTKPIRADELLVVIAKAIERHALQREVLRLRELLTHVKHPI